MTLETLTIAFRFSENVYNHISLNVHTFQDFVSSWLGSVYDYYIIYSCTFRDKFVPFDDDSLLMLIKDNDEDKESEPQNEILTSIWRGFQVSGEIAYEVNDGEACEVTKRLEGPKCFSDDKDDDWLLQKMMKLS